MWSVISNILIVIIGSLFLDISGIFVVVNLSLGIGSLYPVNMIHSYVTLVTITIVTGFPSLIAERGSIATC